MASDVVVSRELKSLQDELASTKKEKDRNANADRTVPTTAAAEPVSPTAASSMPSDEAELQGYLRQLAEEVTDLFGEAEKSISAHPTQSVAGALVLGILIGRLHGRR
ncbi:hypothetical protein [Bradyrhizobium sp. CB2312]|uniref:hypothetical protein n=1 Tax=Bradyrhizobium sp. CB2312 TaxID=3039155 RepID=UPI0024B1347A|nr:hypothetical protein [Bradyrhizobium sp. CB2312]WFU75550.1 hypothetical protein QA642_16875 [Bradyrhizobium sp. CB2312]